MRFGLSVLLPSGMAACFILAVPAAYAAARRSPALVPWPAQLELQDGAWTLDRNVRVVAQGKAAAEAGKLVETLAGPLGWRIPNAVGSTNRGDLVFLLDESRGDLAEEGYELRVNVDGVQLIAQREAGLFYAGQTLRQLLPEAAWRQAPVSPAAWTAPCLRVMDRPRFGWRGLLLDPARHFIPKTALFEMVDAMAVHKLNRLQLHLTDDQGWRIELRAYPRLTARASWRDGTVLGAANDTNAVSKVPHGGFYSQVDLRELVAYAAARHIVVVPEVEMPGHAGAWLAAYPEFAVFPERASKLRVGTRWGVNPNVLAPRAQTLEACRRILDEVCEIFPSSWIHIGGDEAPRDQWRESAEMQELIRSLNLRNEDELQAWFTAQLSQHLAAKGRRLVGWDEILQGAALAGGSSNTTLAANAIAMVWRGWLGKDNEQAAAKAGHDTIMALTEYTYFDYYQGPAAEEPLASGDAISLARVYSFDPAPSGLPEPLSRHILGAQAQLWGEFLSHSDAIGYMTWPRACALAEVCWSPAGCKDLPRFLDSLEQHERRLRAMGIPHRPLARRVSLPGDSGEILAPAAEAVVHGTEITRQPDGTVTNWKNPETLLAWRVELPAAGRYRARVLLTSQTTSPRSGWLEALVGGASLRADLNGANADLELGVLALSEPGPHLVFLRAGGAEVFPAVRGLMLSPTR